MTSEVFSFDIEAADIDPSARNTLPPYQEVDSAHVLHSFQPPSENDDSSLIRKSAEKSCPLDPMTTFLLVGCLTCSPVACYFTNYKSFAIMRPFL